MGLVVSLGPEELHSIWIVWAIFLIFDEKDNILSKVTYLLNASSVIGIVIAKYKIKIISLL